ncbi:MAG: phosphoglucosamine mutase [Ruminococcus sp.]|nr:phosphoglucosamine mutase [Ruminococcus sp.]MDE6784545.1 phosphoglucosamine mutase [Ruminococcus sp.]
MGRIFGRDGIRGLAVTELTCEFAIQLGRAFVAVMAGNKKNRTKVLVGRDTRNSADTIEAALCAGICSAGADAEIMGEVPTAALAWNIKQRGACGGIMITTSRGGSEYSGMKLFSHYGYRLGDDRESEIERLIRNNSEEIEPKTRNEYGNILHCESALDDYMNYIMELSSNVDLRGMKIAVDCANGCASYTAEKLFTDLGAEVIITGSSPDGFNINQTGSTNIEDFMSFVTDNKCCCGIAFDGAAERCLAVDEDGLLVDGDAIVAVIGEYMSRNGNLRHNTILVTHANNLGLLNFARSKGICASRAPSGERSRLRRMLECSYSLGGDPSGHVLFPDDIPTADGQLTAVRLLEVMKKTGRKMSSIGNILEKLPQIIMSVPIKKELCRIWRNDLIIMGAVNECEEMLGDEGRVVVTEAGDEKLIRVLVEGRKFSEINGMAMHIVDTITERMNKLADI